MSTPLARFDGLTKRYGSMAVVDDLTFDVPEGAVIGLLGPNGAGKTTSIRVLLGLARPSGGHVELLATRPGTDAFAGAVRQVGSLIEGPALFARATARDNLRIEAAARSLTGAEGQIAELLELVGLTERADTPAGRFSLGMKQRLGLALALLGKPRLVVLDEPTNGLDPAGIAEVRDLIRRLPERGTTVLVSSHQLAEVQVMCDRATILHRGRLVAEGSIGELLARHGGGGFTVGVGAVSVERAVDVLAAAGMRAQRSGDGRLTVLDGVTEGARVSRALAEQGIYVTELVPLAASLEQVFLELTDDHAPVPTGPALQEA